jgi:hypothetical protein
MDIPEMSRNDEFTKRLNAETVEIVLAVAGGLFVACLFVACLFALGVVLTVGHRPLLVINLVILSLIYLSNFNGKCDSLNDIQNYISWSFTQRTDIADTLSPPSLVLS